MSNRPASTRGRGSEKEGTNLEPVTSRHDVKAGEFNPRPRIQSDKSPGPSRGGRWQTGDRDVSSTSGRFTFSKPRDRNEASFLRRRNTDKMGGFGRGGRRGDAPGHGGQGRTGQSETSSNSGMHGGGKLFMSREFNTGSDMKSSVDGSGGKPFSDDSRLSKLMRRACREDERERRLQAIHQLKDYLLQPENAKGIVKTTDSLLVALQDMFYERSFKEMKQEAAECIGIVGSVMGSDAQRYLQWLFTKLTAAPTDEAKILFLQALLQTLEYDDAKRKLADFMPMITTSTQGVLENADLPELLVAVVDVIQHIVARYPQVFSSHFRDTVDILVGWHIDATQKESLTDYTSNALVAFHQFWLADIHFSLTLLGQFLEDMEAYAEDLGLGLNGQGMKEEEVPTPDECITKIAALLRVYGTVVKSLGEFFTPEKQAQFSWEYIIENLERIVKCTDSAINKLFSESVLTAANRSLLLLVGNLGNGTARLRESTVLAFVVRQMNMRHSFSNKYLVSLLALTHRLIEILTTNLPVSFITDLLGPQSLLNRLRFGHSREMLASLMSVYHIILSIKNVPLLEEAYRHVLGDLEMAYNTLLRHAASDYRCMLVPVDNNPFSSVEYDSESAEAAIVFAVCALAEIGNAKNNLIGMWALSPSIFDLLAHRLLPSKPSVLVQYPAVQFVFLQILYSHCSRHGHFIASSNLITMDTILGGSLLANVSPSTGAHFGTVLGLLRDLLASRVTPYDSNRLALKWVEEITEALLKIQRIYKSHEFHAVVIALITVGYSNENDISMQACRCLQSILQGTNNCHTVVIIRRCAELCWSRLSETDQGVREAFISLMCLLPSIFLTGLSNSPSLKSEVRKSPADDADHMGNYWLAHYGHMTRTPTATFQSHHFRSIMAFLLLDVTPSAVGGNAWLQRIFHSCQRTDKDTLRQSNPGPLARMIDNNAALQWFWATWEAAQFCVLAKLRTPLGKPQDTFTMIEAVLKKYSTEGARRDADDAKTKSGVGGDNQDEKSMDWEDVYCRLLRPCALLQFMEYLEKLLYNAYEGYAVVMPSPPKVVRTFFRTNRNTCQEWLTRVRRCVIAIAAHCGQTSLVVWHAFELLRDMDEMGTAQGPDFVHVVMQAVEALCQLRCPEAILGLYAWCREVTGVNMAWVKAAVEAASGRDEVGVVEFKATLKSYVVPADSNVKELWDSSHGQSQNGSPVGSPKHTDIVQRFSILSKHHGAASTGGNGTAPGDGGADPVVAGFMVRQICESYMRLDSWQDMLDWHDTLQQYRSEHTGGALVRAFTSPYDTNYIKALSSFDEHDFESVPKHLELVPGMSLSDSGDSQRQPTVPWDTRDVIDTANKQFVYAITLSQTTCDWRSKLDSISRCLEDSVRWSESVLRCGMLQWPQRLDPAAQMTLNMSEACRRQLNEHGHESWLVAPCVDGKLEATEQEVGTLTRALHMLKLQSFLHTSLGFEETAVVGEIACHVSDLRLATARVARRHHNLQLAERLLVDEVCSNVTAPEDGATSATSARDALTRVYATNSVVERTKLLRIEREVSKLMHARGQHRDAIETLSTSVVNEARLVVESESSKATVGVCRQLNTRSMLLLVQWLQLDHKNLATLASQVKVVAGDDEVRVTEVARNLSLLLEMERSGALVCKGLGVNDAPDSDEALMDLRIGENPVLGESDAMIGRLLHLGSMNCPTLGKSWFTFAGWCYKWGRKAVDNAMHGSIEFTSDEKALIHDVLPKGANSEDTDTVFNILSQLHTAVGSEEDISDQDQSLYDDGAEAARRQLLSGCQLLQVASDGCIDRLLAVWQRAVRHIYSYYQLSAKAYFTYVKLSAQDIDDLTAMDGNITATLRILRLLVKHAWELRGVLEDGLTHTPTAPWKGIIPQLFSRLNHPEPYVRQSVSELLCRVAHDAPHLIVYPAVVGCSSNKVLLKDSLEDALLNDYLSQNDGDKLDPEHSTQQEMRSPGGGEEELEIDDDSNDDAVLQNCFAAIVDTLAHSNPQYGLVVLFSRMIADVKLLVSELRRITLLWDELWLGTLNQHHQDITRRLAQLNNEIKKVMNNASLSADMKELLIAQKHSVLLKPTVFTVERLYDITRQPAETEHERWFQKTYGKAIEDALHCLKTPTNPSTPHTSWLPFKQLHHSLQQRAQKRSSLVLSMDQISSKLSNLKSSVIAMPGLSSEGKMVNIDSIHNVVQILPTKTKPKKLVFIGCDGNKYTYLFKGLEDLHLDERIMQFLSIVNNMFAKANRNEQRQYHARHYSVTPLGARSGLIQWVDGATPLFSLYKRWQQRDAVTQQQKHQQQGASSQAVAPNPPAVPRPSEVYYSKLTPALKEKGVSNLESRKEWPLTVTRAVLEELMDDTPKDLLARELWGSSTSATEWWQITQCYARSTAVMSMIGYIIGLGDRHLDNVLVDLTTGEVVHIDYNVCFEKGKGLRVPEKVPFRMTQNIEVAFGVTGVEGVFRMSCEHVIRTMRKGRETLLTLLEAFVYDPLVDWTTGNEGGYTGAFCGGDVEAVRNIEGRQSRKDMDRDITLNMFSIRIAEMKAAWITNKEEMLASLPALKSTVQSHVTAQDELHAAGSHVDRLQHQVAYLEESLHDSQHAFYTLPHRYSEFSLVKSTRLEVLQAVQEKLSECDHWNTAYKFALNAVQGSKLQKMCAQVNHPLNLTTSSFDPVVEFLQSAGQGQMVIQCEQATTELSAVVHQRRGVLRSCLDVLHTYATIVSQYPANYVDNCRTTRWQHWLQEHISCFTCSRCKQTVSEYEEAYGVTSARLQGQVQMVLATEIKLQSNITDINSRLVKLVERRNMDATETSALTLYAQESTNAVHQFVKDEDVGGALCMTNVVVTALCSLARRYIIMESAAAAAGDRLMDLTSRDGDWFLDELCSMSANINQMIALIADPTMCQLASDELRQQVVLAMQTTHAVYLSLQDLHVNFRNIILPETLKCFSTDNPSMLCIVASLDAILDDDVYGVGGVESLLSSLEGQLCEAEDGGVTETVSTEAAARVKQLWTRFDELLQAPTDRDGASELSSGQMLLMGFNGLFLQLEADFSAMLEVVTRLRRVPDQWMTSVDVLSEASVLQVLTMSDHTRNTLSRLFFLKQLVSLRQFFHMCRDCTQNKGSVSGPCYDDDQLTRPVQHFIAEYVRKHMIGLPSKTLGVILCHYVGSLNVDISAELSDGATDCPVSLDEVCKRALALEELRGTFQSGQLIQASDLIASLDVNWRKLDLARRLDSNTALLRSSVHRAQLDLARYQWLNEDVFTKAGCALSQMAMPARTTVMSELRKGVQALVSHETSVVAVQERHLVLETSITQRLKWAAGANPSLSATLQQFEETLAENSVILQTEAVLASEAVTLCNAILHFEALRTRTTEAVSADASFLSLINRCDECCQLVETCSSSVSEVEESLMLNKLVPPGEKITAELIRSLLGYVGDQITGVNSRLGDLRSSCNTTKDGVRAHVGCIRGILTTHHKLMSDVRSILKSMAKQEELDPASDPPPGTICEYVNVYKTFSENFTAVLKQVVSDDITASVLSEIDAMTGLLVGQINRIYDDLVKFAPPLLVDDQLSGHGITTVSKASVDVGGSIPAISSKKALQRPDLQSTTASPQTGAVNLGGRKQEKIARDPRTGKAIQERNSYAVGVWKRIKMKLDGRDPDINRRLSVAEQVDYVIKEATDLDNLAVLYEGWTPWV